MSEAIRDFETPYEAIARLAGVPLVVEPDDSPFRKYGLIKGKSLYIDGRVDSVNGTRLAFFDQEDLDMFKESVKCYSGS